MTRLTIIREGLSHAITPETIVCRCESITRAEVVAEIEAGAASHNALKSGTRLGMGPCGGKFCGETGGDIELRGDGPHSGGTRVAHGPTSFTTSAD